MKLKYANKEIQIEIETEDAGAFALVVQATTTLITQHVAHKELWTDDMMKKLEDYRATKGKEQTATQKAIK